MARVDGRRRRATSTRRRWYVSIRRASVRDLERLTSGTTLNARVTSSRATFHPGVTRETQITFDGRTFYVNDVQNVEERGIQMILFCQEVVA